MAFTLAPATGDFRALFTNANRDKLREQEHAELVSTWSPEIDSLVTAMTHNHSSGPGAPQRSTVEAANGVIFTSAYWTVFGGPGGNPPGSLASRINADFSSLSGLKSAVRGVAGGPADWVVVGWDAGLGKLIVVGAPMEELGQWAGTPIMAFDVSSRAVALSKHSNTDDYVDSCFDIVDWFQAKLRYDIVNP